MKNIQTEIVLLGECMYNGKPAKAFREVRGPLWSFVLEVKNEGRILLNTY